MLRTILTLIVCLVAIPLQARQLDEHELLDLILANDVVAVEQGFQSARDAYRTGEKGPDHLRTLNSVFETTSPKISEFANAWLEKYPDSPHANIANASIYYTVGWVLRGEAVASKTYHEAMRAFSRMMYKADHYAMKAYDQDRHLLTVTDTLLRLTAVGYSQLPHEGLIGTVMGEQPNAGSMSVALYGAAPGWGGTREYGDRLCNSFATDVPEWGSDGVDTCKVLYLGRHYRAQPRDWWLETLSRIENPVTQEYRHKATVWFNLQVPEWRESLIKMFDDPTYVDLEYAEEFDNRYAEFNPDVALASPKVRPRAMEWAKQRLVYDPYNTTAIAVLSNQMKYERASDGAVIPKYDRTLDRSNQKFDLARREVIVQPWNWMAWSRFASNVPNSYTEQGFQLRRNAEINGLVYSNYNPESLYMIIVNLLLKKENLSNIAKTHPDPDVVTFLSRLEKNSDAEIDCPVARTALIMRHICTAESGPWVNQRNSCNWMGTSMKEIASILDDLTERKACKVDLLGPIEDLLYSPIEIDLHALDGS